MSALMLSIAFAFAAAHAHESRGSRTAPVSTVVQAYVDAVGAEGNIVREIELGAPALALSGFVLYPQSAMEPISVATAGSQVDLRFTATGLLR
jgi:hypothetical protein